MELPRRRFPRRVRAASRAAALFALLGLLLACALGSEAAPALFTFFSS